MGVLCRGGNDRRGQAAGSTSRRHVSTGVAAMAADRPRPLQFSLLSLFLLTLAVSLLLSAAKAFGPAAVFFGAYILGAATMLAQEQLRQSRTEHDPAFVETLQAYARGSLLALAVFAIAALAVVILLVLGAALVLMIW